MAEKKEEKKEVVELSDQEIIEIQEKRTNKRIEICKIAIDEVLKKYNCFFNISIVITEKGNFPQLTIISK